MKGNVKSRTNMGNAESRALYERYKGMRVDCRGIVIGWSDEPDLIVIELYSQNGWSKESASVGCYSEKKLKDGSLYWYITENHIKTINL